LDTGRIVAELKRERDRLSRAIAALEGESPKAAAKKSSVPNRAAHSKKRGGRLTPEGRKRLSDLMKKRWAEKRKKASKGRQ
jgi:Spy/CpxP family protein refolding chaperone